MADSGRCRQADAALIGLRQRLSGKLERRRGSKWKLASRALRRWLELVRSGRLPARLASRLGGKASPLAASELQAARETYLAAADAELASFLADGRRLAFAGGEDAQLSVILVLYNQAAFTLRSLRSLAADATGPMQVILVDNGSTDATELLLRRIDGAQVVRSPHNLHYLKGVNLGASEARGEFLLLLNNDIELAPGSLVAALDLLRTARDVGAVGGRLVRPNGLLQEAGNIVWQDGGCFSYGADQPPEIGPCMFQRDVDYVSGAFLMTRRELFERLGRFDEALAPAYYEETDYCLRLWQAGYRVVFDPRILVHHYEFASGSKEAATALMRRNQAILVNRHRRELRARHLPALPEYPLPARSRDWDRIVGRALVLTELLPCASGDGEQRRAVAIVRALEAASWFVTVHPLTSDETGWEAIRASLAMTVEVMRGQDLTGLPEFLRDRAGYYDRALVIGASGWTRLGTDRTSAAALAGLGLICDAQGADLLGAAPPLDLPLTDPDWSGFVTKLEALLAAENAA